MTMIRKARLDEMSNTELVKLLNNQFNPSKVWPIGSIYLSFADINPATTLGFGTWVKIGQGMNLVSHP